MAMKTILDSIKKHKGKFTNEQVETIRIAVTKKMADDPRKKVTGVKAETYESYRQKIKHHKLDRSKTVWIAPGSTKAYDMFNVTKTID